MSLGEANQDLRRAQAQLAGEEGYPNQANIDEVWQDMPGRYYVLGSDVLLAASRSGVAHDHDETLTDVASDVLENGSSVQSAAALMRGTLAGSGNPDAELATEKAEAAVLANDEQKQLIATLMDKIEVLDKALDTVKELADDVGRLATKAAAAADKAMAERTAAAEALGRYLSGTE